MGSFKKLKILWAVDAFDDLKDIQEKEIQILQSFSHKVELEVTPAYVLSPAGLKISSELSEQWTDVYDPSAKKKLASYLKDVRIAGIGDPLILIQEQPSLKRNVEVFTKFAQANGYDLILCGSHGRKGMQRLMLGSFAEELLLQSQTPVLIVGKHMDSWDDRNLSVLLPNDLSNPRSSLFTQTFNFAKTLGARVTLLHSIPRPIEQVLESGIYLFSGGWLTIPLYLENERKKKTEAAQPILTKARSDEIACELLIDDTSQSVTDSILMHAREKKFSFIAMVAERGPVTSTLLGSITRQVVRAAPCPVLVYRLHDAE